MQINGLREFVSQFTPRLDQLGTKNAANPFMIRAEKDFLDISDIGKRLSFRSDKTELLNPKAAKTNGDPDLEMMDKAMNNMETILNQMKDLALLASDTNYTAADRLQMQIQMEELRGQLVNASKGIHGQPAIGSGIPYVDIIDGVGTGFLERAHARALKGEAWDVGETFENIVALRRISVGGEVFDVGEWGDGGKGERFELPPDTDPDDVQVLANEVLGIRFVTTDDKDALTVTQLLEKSGSVILMDAKSAMEGVERIEKELDALKEMREAFAAFCEQYTPAPSGNNKKMSDAEVYAMIGKIMQEEQARAEALRSMLDPPKALSDGASVNGEESEGGESAAQIQNSRLEGPKGEMFAKIERLFAQITNSFMSKAASEPSPIAKMEYAWTNWTPPASWPTKAA
jgi:hypothetical protein